MGVNMKRNAIYEKLLLDLTLDSVLSEALFSVGGKMIKIFGFVKYSTFNLFLSLPKPE